MAIFDQIPETIENLQTREAIKYRTRCAWGGNHLRKLDSRGDILSKSYARIEDPSFPLACALDGYRPSQDPLNAAYQGAYKSQGPWGRPLRRQPQNPLDDQFSGGAAGLDGRSPDTVDGCYDAWHDPGSEFQVNGSGQLVRNAATSYQNYIDLGCTEYDITVRQYVDNAGAYDAGVMFRYRDSNNFFMARIHSNSGGQIELLDRNSQYGGPTQIAVNTTYTLTVGWKVMRIINTKTRVRIIVDGVQYIDYGTPGAAAGKQENAYTKMGFYSWTGCNPQWDYVMVWRPWVFFESFPDWTNWNLSTYGPITGNASSISTNWAKLTGNTSVKGTRAGYVARLNVPRATVAPVDRDSFFQFQLGKNKTVPTGADYNEIGFLISDDNTITDVGLEQNAIYVSLKSYASGTARIQVGKFQGGAETLIYGINMSSPEYSGNIRIECGGGTWKVYENKIGLLVSQALTWLPQDVYVKIFTRSTETQTLSGYIRDVGVFWTRNVYVGGEVGYKEEFDSINTDAWYPLFNTEFWTQVTQDGENAGQFDSSGAWRTLGFVGRCDFGDFRMVDRVHVPTGGRVNWFWRSTCQLRLGYGTQLHATETPKIFKNSNAGIPVPWGQVIAEGDLADAIGTGTMEIVIEVLGPEMRIYKDGNLIVQAVDNDYWAYQQYYDNNAGYIAANTYGDGLIHLGWSISERGLQQPVTLRIDHGMVHNPSFEEWDEDEGLTDATTENTANGWRSSMSPSGAITKDSNGVDGGLCQKMTFTTPSTDAYFFNELYQRGIRFMDGHKYRVSLQFKGELISGSNVGGYPVLWIECRNSSNAIQFNRMYPLANPDSDLLIDGEWHQLNFEVEPYLAGQDYDRLYLTLKVTTPVPGNITLNPQNDFAVYFDQVMVEDLTGLLSGALPDLTFQENPDSYRGIIEDREEANTWCMAFAKAPLNKIWRAGESKSWGLLDANMEDLFTSRDYTDMYPGDEWTMKPQWVVSDMGVPLTVNQITLYSLYTAGIRWFHLTGDGNNYVTHSVTKVFDGSIGHDSQNKWDRELEAPIDQRYIQVIFLDVDEEGYLLTLQQLELYNYGDESLRIHQDQDSSPQVAISTTRSNGINSLPDATQFSMSLNNYDARYTPRNKFSEIYGFTQQDGLGDIRSNIPVRISMLLTYVVADLEINKAFADECWSDGYWPNGGANLTNWIKAGMLGMSLPSSPPPNIEARSDAITADVSYYRQITFNIDEVINPESPQKLKWKFGVRTSDQSFPDATWLTDWNDNGAGVYTFDMVDDVGISGVQSFELVFALEYFDGFPTHNTTFVVMDYFYLQNIPVYQSTTYETLMLIGTIGIDKNVGGALGISLDGKSKVATIEGVDFTVLLDQPCPTDLLDVWETELAEDVMKKLCYLAGIPEQDLDFDDTGVTFPTVILREQTLRETINEIVDVIGGRMFTEPSGRLVYQNEYPYRSWEQSERDDFERGIATNTDILFNPGEIRVGSVLWAFINHFNVLPESESTPWTVEDGEPTPRRYISDGKYYVQIPSDRYTTMKHTMYGNFNKTTGFTIEFTADFFPGAGYFDIWGYCDNVVDRWTPDSAWRIRIYRDPIEYGQIMRCAGGGVLSINNIVEPSMWYTGFTNTEKYRIRITVSGNNVSMTVNNCYVPQFQAIAFQLTAPWLLNWSPYQEGWEVVEGLRDYFSGYATLATHVPDTNQTGNSNNYIDPGDTWYVNNGYVVQRKWLTPAWPSWDVATSYFDLRINQFDMYCGIYLDRTTANNGGIRFYYKDAANYYIFQFNTWASGTPSKMWVQAYTQQVVGGVATTLDIYQPQEVFEGQCQIHIDTRQAIRCYWRALAGGGTGWFWVTNRYVDIDFYGATKFSFAAAPNNGTSFDDLTVDADDEYYGWIDDDYVGKVVIGPCPTERSQNKNYDGGISLESKYWNGQTYRCGYWLDYFSAYLSGAVHPVDSGSFESQPYDCTAAIESYGIFEAEIFDTHYQFAPVKFYVAKSADGMAWDAWETVTPGELIPGAVKRWIKWKAEFQFYYPSGLDYTFGYIHWNPLLRGVTINWLVNTAGTIQGFRVTYDISAPTTETTIGQELDSVGYSMGNPLANRIPIAVNKWIEQAITTYTGPGTGFWESNDLPQTINAGEVYVARAQYQYPSKKGSGGTLRNAHVTINATPYVLNDGDVDVTCGGCQVSFESGQAIGTVTIQATAAGQTISVIAIDAVGFIPAGELNQEENVFVEDEVSQAIVKRVIESEIVDNNFSMTRAIAEAYGEAYLDRAKKHRESVSGITFPVKPSINLGKHGVIHVPNIGFNEKQIMLTEVEHSGFQTVVGGEAVDTREIETYDPLTDSPAIVYATHRLENCQSTYIFQMLRQSDSAVINVYEVMRGAAYYRTTANGVWIPATDTYFLITFFDQSGNGNDATQAVAANRPQIYFNQANHNGWPGVLFDGSNDVIDAAYDISPGVTPNITVFARVTPSSVPGVGKIYGHDNGSYDRCIGFDYRVTNNNLCYFYGAAAPNVKGAGNIWTAIDYIITHEYQTVLSSVWVNEEVRVIDEAVANGAGAAVLSIGNINAGSYSEYFPGYISAFYLYPAVLSDAVREDVRDYINSKYKVF